MDTPKCSVVVIAHNEAKYIARCLESIRRQTLRPDEIILIAHNCTDETVEIAEGILKPLGRLGTMLVQNDGIKTRVVELSGSEGPLFARARGFEEAKGDIIACIDGDSYALTKNWLQRLIYHLSDLGNPAVGGGVWVVEGLRPWLMSLDFFWLKPIYVPILNFFGFKKFIKESVIEWHYFWGANFAIRRSVYQQIGGLEPLIELKSKIGLSFDAEDFYLALKASQVGKVGIDPLAVVVSVAAKTNWKKRIPEHGRDKEKLINYLNRSQ